MSWNVYHDVEQYGVEFNRVPSKNAYGEDIIGRDGYKMDYDTWNQLRLSLHHAYDVAPTAKDAMSAMTGMILLFNKINIFMSLYDKEIDNLPDDLKNKLRELDLIREDEDGTQVYLFLKLIEANSLDNTFKFNVVVTDPNYKENPKLDYMAETIYESHKSTDLVIILTAGEFKVDVDDEWPNMSIYDAKNIKYCFR